MNKLLRLFVLICGCVVMFTANAFAAEGNGTPQESVYASKADQHAISEKIHRSNEIAATLRYDAMSIIVESITPVYLADFLEYAQTGVFRFWLDTIAQDAESREKSEYAHIDGKVYIAKTVTADGAFAGNLRFYVEDGAAHSLGFEPSLLLERYHADLEPPHTQIVSRSYADHARRIQRLTSRESFVPISEVRYVVADGLGEVFYINDGRTEALVLISANADVFEGNTGEIVYIGDELRGKANVVLAEHMEFINWLEEWKLANPSEPLPDGGVGLSFSSLLADSRDVDDVYDIPGFLGDAFYVNSFSTSSLSQKSSVAVNDGNGIELSIVMIAVTATAICVGGGLILFLKNRNRSRLF